MHIAHAGHDHTDIAASHHVFDPILVYITLGVIVLVIVPLFLYDRRIKKNKD